MRCYPAVSCVVLWHPVNVYSQRSHFRCAEIAQDRTHVQWLRTSVNRIRIWTSCVQSACSSHNEIFVRGPAAPFCLRLVLLVCSLRRLEKHQI